MNLSDFYNIYGPSTNVIDLRRDFCLTHFLHKLHQIVNKWNILGGNDEVLSSKPDTIDTIQKFTIFVIEIALNKRTVNFQKYSTSKILPLESIIQESYFLEDILDQP